MGTWDEIGYRGSDSDINRRIRETRLESNVSDFSPESLRRAFQIVNIEDGPLRRYTSKREYLDMIRALKELGFPLENMSYYSGMKRGRLHHYFSELAREIKKQNRLTRTS